MNNEPTISELTLTSNQLEDDIQYLNDQVDRINIDLETTYAALQNLTMELRQYKADNKVEHEYFFKMDERMVEIAQHLLNVTKQQQKQIQTYKYWLCALTTATAALLLITLL